MHFLLWLLEKDWCCWLEHLFRPGQSEQDRQAEMHLWLSWTVHFLWIHPLPFHLKSASFPHLISSHGLHSPSVSFLLTGTHLEKEYAQVKPPSDGNQRKSKLLNHFEQLPPLLNLKNHRRPVTFPQSIPQPTPLKKSFSITLCPLAASVIQNLQK